MLRGGSPIKAALVSAAFLFAAGCGAPGSFRGTDEIAAWAGEQGFAKATMQVGAFRLASFARKPLPTNDTLAVYIEGDGAAWPTPYLPPQDPTPTRPISLAMAAADPALAVAYLGRPCQYLDAQALQGCDSAYWTERRFAPEVVEAYDEAVSRLKSRFAARKLRLFGYSGGGVIATLLAARRDDVEVLVTIAAPLAVTDWAARHGVSPLKGSLDPVELGENVRLPPGAHFVGGDDKVVPAEIVAKFVRRKGGRSEVIPAFGHECCWAKDWKDLLGRISVQENTK